MSAIHTVAVKLYTVLTGSMLSADQNSSQFRELVVLHICTVVAAIVISAAYTCQRVGRMCFHFVSDVVRKYRGADI